MKKITITPTLHRNFKGCPSSRKRKIRGEKMGLEKITIRTRYGNSLSEYIRFIPYCTNIIDFPKYSDNREKGK